MDPEIVVTLEEIKDLLGVVISLGIAGILIFIICHNDPFRKL